MFVNPTISLEQRSPIRLKTVLSAKQMTRLLVGDSRRVSMPSNPRSLFSFPVELRLQILHDVLVASGPIHLAYNGQFYLGGPILHTSRQHLAILRTCRALYIEGLPVFLRNNVFISLEPDKRLYRPFSSPRTGRHLNACAWPYAHECYTKDPFTPPGDSWFTENDKLCRSPIPSVYLRFLKRICLVLFKEITSNVGSLVGAGLLLESLAVHEAQLDTIYLFAQREGGDYYPLTEPNPSSMSAIRALLYPLKHLLNASPVPKLHICSFACRTFEDLVKLDDIYRMAHNVLSNGYIDADGQYSSSHASSRVGLYFSAFSQFSPHIDLHVHDEGHEHHVFFSGSGEFKTANYQTLDEWEDEEKLFFWCKTWPATKSAPHMGYLDDAELENYGVAMTYSHRYLVLRLAVSSRKFWWNIFDLYDGIQNPPENNRDELIVRDDSWRGTRPYSWWPGKEVDVAAFLNRWALYETGNKPIQRKITEFFQPLFG